jgi:broad specificity phosphatase PhoE
MAELWLARHGQTDWNVEGRYQGHADVPLNTLGLCQAAELAQKLEGQTFAAIFSSDLRRARQTAESVAARLGLPVRLDARLREIDQGDWEGRLVREIAELYAEEWHVNPADPEKFAAPNGETIGQVSSRVGQAADEIARQFPRQPVLIISHGLALAILICRARKIPLGQVYHHIPPNAEAVPITWR